MAHARRAKVKDPAKAFISTWRTGTVYTGSTANNQIKLPLEVAGTYKFTVNWGDTTSNVITSWDQAETLHTYPAPGDYTVTITGFIKGWEWGGGAPTPPTTGDMRKLLTVTQFGCLRFIGKDDGTNTWGAFYGCTNLNLTAVQDVPNFKGTTSMQGFLRLSSAITTVNNINKWDVSKIQIFRSALREMLFFDDNVGNWNTGNGVEFTSMFLASPTSGVSGIFNNGGSSSIKNWDTSSAVSMSSMFTNQRLFNQEVGLWDVSNVTNFTQMFSLTGTPGSFNNGGSDSMKNWNTSKATTMRTMFQNQINFNQEVGLWDVGNVTDFTFFVSMATPRIGVFNNNGSNSIRNWNTSNVTSTRSMFQNQTSFNQEVGLWDMSKVTDMSAMFFTAATTAVALGVFNNGGSPSINNWNTSNVTNMSSAFTGQRFFNQPIGNWDTSKVTNMQSMFYASNVIGFPGVFNQDIGNWNTGNVTNMSLMFVHQINFNQNIGNWNVGKVTNFSNFITGILNGATAIFNNGGSPSINNWNTGLVTNMNSMFRFCIGFNQPIGNWNVSLVTDFGNFMQNKTFNDYSAANYDALLIGWASRPVQANRSLNFNTIKYTAAASAARAILTSAPNNWTIVDGGLVA